MKPSNEDILLSKNNAKTLLFRNAHDAAALKKEARLLQKEWNSEEKMFLKQRERMLQRQTNLTGELSPKSRRKAAEKNMLSVSTSSLPEELSPSPHRRVTITRSKTFSDAYRRPMSSDAMKTSLSSSSAGVIMSEHSPPLRSIRPVLPARSSTPSTLTLPASALSVGDQQLSPLLSPRPRSKTFSESVKKLSDSSSTFSLPDINLTSLKTSAKFSKSETKLKWKGRKNAVDEDICVLDDLQDMRKCRYLRTSSLEK